MLKKLLVITFVFILLSLNGCNDASTKELTPVVVQLKWLDQAQFAGNYVAKDLGYYEDMGLDVELRPFDFVRLPIEEVQNKNADFGITGADELLIAKINGKADNVKAVAVIYKTNPVCLYSLAENEILSPSDLIGKTVGIEKASNGEDINVGIAYYAMLSKLGINRSEINEVTIGYDASELLAAETDVSSGYIINEPYGVLEAGKEVNIILVADYGVNIYADVIIAHEDTINEKPELVLNFLKATLDGWQYAIEHEDEAVNIVLNYAQNANFEHQKYMLQKTIPLIHTGDSPLGWMNSNDWIRASDILFEQKVLSKEPDINSVYTNKFIEQLYGEN